MNRLKIKTLWSSIILFNLIVFEASSYVIYNNIIFLKAKFLVYNPPNVFDENEYERYLSNRHELLGWPTVDKKNDSRITPAFPEARDNCISLYGDSFIYANEVDHEQAWGNILSEKLGCRVGNFGVGGYGTDQAYLRFTDNPNDRAPITILGIYPENLLRNVNQYRFLLTGGEQHGFKPRFILKDKNLQLIPIPDIRYEELELLYQDPKQYLQHEAFLPDSDYGPVSFSFPTVQDKNLTY